MTHTPGTVALALACALVPPGAYLSIGWRLATGNREFFWARARARWEYGHENQSRSARVQFTAMWLMWPIYGITVRVDKVVRNGDPNERARREHERRAYVRALERDLGYDTPPVTPSRY